MTSTDDETRQTDNSDPDSQIPVRLWNMVRLGLVGLAAGIVALVIAVANGAADPRPVGSLKWEDHFAGAVEWETFGRGATLDDRALDITPGRDEVGGAVTGPAAAEYSFEAAGGQAAGEVGAAYGIVFDYQDPGRYTAVLINGNGYVEVISAGGRQYLAWQQWPNILLAFEANRLRVDVQGGHGLIRINDEILLTVPVSGGRVGVAARGSAPGQRVRFGWAKYWAE